MKMWHLAIAAALACGCASAPSVSPQPQPAPEVTVEQKDPFDGQMSEGIKDSLAATRKLTTALKLARGLAGKAIPDLDEAMKDMVATLDDDRALLGSLVADNLVGGEIPTPEAVGKRRSEFKSRRSPLLDAVSDTLVDLREQEGIAASLAVDGPDATKSGFGKLDDILNAAIDHLIVAKKALGGKEEAGQYAPDTADTNGKPSPGY